LNVKNAIFSVKPAIDNHLLVLFVKETAFLLSVFALLALMMTISIFCVKNVNFLVKNV